MAVKKHKLVTDGGEKFNWERLSQFLEMMSPNYMPPVPKFIQFCRDIITFLACPKSGNLQIHQLDPVEKFLRRVMRNVTEDARLEIFTAIIDKFHFFISNPQEEVCPSVAIVLTTIDDVKEKSAKSAARCLVQQCDSGTRKGLRAALACLYRWISQKRGTPAVATWLLVYINALEENERTDILVKPSLENIAQMFSSMSSTENLEKKTADAIFHVLTSLRESPEAFDRIATHVADVLENLAGESAPWIRQLLQNVVDIVTAMVNYNLASLKKGEREYFRGKYADAIFCLKRHMASGASSLLEKPIWRTRTVNLRSAPSGVPFRKVGLRNMGNTCYINSVLQALLLIRQFSNHVVLRMSAAPYWSVLAGLFAKMMHSITKVVVPDDILRYVVQPFFSNGSQHDSSEFLGYLFQLLVSYENRSERNFDYSRSPVLNGGTHLRLLIVLALSDDEAKEAERQSVSPKPGSSNAGCSSSGQKRSGEGLPLPAKKRLRASDTPYPRRISFIDLMFGGVLRTHVKCKECNGCSVSRDVFRDLQLSFPEKSDGRQFSIQSLLEYYCAKESLSGDNKYSCHMCDKLRDAERSVFIEIIPKYLILVLKNFNFDSKSQMQTKLMHSVYYNHTVTLPTLPPKPAPIFNLFAAVIHSGTTLDSGHYFTIAKSGEQWHKYNDDKVTLSDESQLSGPNLSITPYILFYRRSDVEEGAAPALNELPPKLQEKVMSHNKEFVDNVRNICANRP